MAKEKKQQLKDREISFMRTGNPYVPDLLIKDGVPTKLWALTKKNAKFIEAVIKIDSNYGWDGDKNNQPYADDDITYNPIEYIESNAKKSRNQAENKVDVDEPKNNEDVFKNKPKFYGSTAYWFARMKRSKNDFNEFKTCVAGAIVSIDITNSTRMSHLEREKILERLIGGENPLFKNYRQLREALKEHFVPIDGKGKFLEESKSHVFAILAKGIDIKDKKGKDKKRYNFSFASKFCSYAYHYLVENKKNPNPYSRYDNIVSDMLPTYLEYYVYTSESPKDTKSFKVSAGGKFENKLKAYHQYCTLIGCILDALHEKDKISRDELDHIIWYSKK